MKIETFEFDLKSTRPVPLWRHDVENFEEINNEISSTISKHRAENPDGYNDYINVNVWQTGWNMEIEPGFSKIDNLAKTFCNTIAKDYYNFNQFNCKIVDCWSNIYNKDSGCRIHQHFPATFSLVYYVSVPENSGCIFFPDLEIKIQPYPGLLLCFRGDTWHGVEFNQTDKDRIIVAFNIVYS
jgi:hypothetical protein